MAGEGFEPPPNTFGKRPRLRLPARTSAPVSTQYRAARSESSITRWPRISKMRWTMESCVGTGVFLDTATPCPLPLTRLPGHLQQSRVVSPVSPRTLFLFPRKITKQRRSLPPSVIKFQHIIDNIAKFFPVIRRKSTGIFADGADRGGIQGPRG